MGSPTTRSLEWLRERGWRAVVVEKWIPKIYKKKDCFGGDILAVHPATRATLLVQATDGTSHSKRREKCLSNPEVLDWVRVGNKFEIHSWSKRGPRGGTKRWQLRQEQLNLYQLDARSTSG